MSELVSSTNLVDDKNLKFSDIDVEFISTNVNTNYKGAIKSMNPERHLCRFEFLELLVRFSLTKYKKIKPALTHY